MFTTFKGLHFRKTFCMNCYFLVLGCGAETPTSEPGYCAIDLWDEDWEDPEDMFLYRHQVGFFFLAIIDF